MHFLCCTGFICCIFVLYCPVLYYCVAKKDILRALWVDIEIWSGHARQRCNKQTRSFPEIPEFIILFFHTHMQLPGGYVGLWFGDLFTTKQATKATWKLWWKLCGWNKLQRCGHSFLQLSASCQLIIQSQIQTESFQKKTQKKSDLEPHTHR